MRENCTSGSMRGSWKRAALPRRASSLLYVLPPHKKKIFRIVVVALGAG